MKKYRVHTEFDCSEEFETFEEAQKLFEYYKDELMAEGVVENESFVEIVNSEDDFDNYEVVKKVVAIRDGERMAISTPKEDGYDWAYWAKWKEV